MDVTLGLIGLAGQLFTSAVQAYRIFSSAKDLAIDAPIIVWKLRIQELRLTCFGRYWQVEEGNFDELLAEQGLLEDVVGILKQMLSILTDADKLRKRYGAQPTPLVPVSTTQNLPLTGTKTFSEDDEEARIVGTIATTSGSTIGWGSKLRWAIKDKDKFKDLIQDLSDLNDGLQSLMHFRDATWLSQLHQSATLRSIGNEPTSLEHVYQATKPPSLAPSTPNAFKPPVSAAESAHPFKQPHPNQTAQVRASNINPLLQYHIISQFATLKLRALQVETAPLPTIGITTSLTPSDGLCIPSSHVVVVPPNSPSKDRIFGQYNPSAAASQTVLIEWKDVNPSSAYAPLIAKRINDLTFLLSSLSTSSSPPGSQNPVDLRVLPCLGYFEDFKSHRYGLLFAPPPSVCLSPPTNLLVLLSQKSITGGGLPLLGDRFRLAQVLATAFMRYHDCGWVHGSLRSENIVFFRPLEESSPAPTPSSSIPRNNAGSGTSKEMVPKKMVYSGIHLDEPYITGFDYSRPADPDETTLEYSQSNNLDHDVYRHPSQSALSRAHGDTPSAQASRTPSAAPQRDQEQQQHQWRPNYNQQFEKKTTSRTAFELYSLGVVLLEIGLWTPIRALWKDKYTLPYFSQRLRESYVPLLGGKMGAVYEGVVRDLIGAVDVADQTDDPDSEDSLAGVFDKEWRADKGKDTAYWKAVEDLRKCFA